MGWRTVIIANAAKLDYKMGYLCIRSNEEMTRVHLSEISIVLIETPAVSLTAYLLIELANAKINVIFCDSKRLPNGTYQPLYGSHDTSDKLRKQICWDNQSKKHIWSAVVAHKIEGQKCILEAFNHQKEAMMLETYISQIEEGDVTNREGHAAKVYFNALFGKQFTRVQSEELINAELNYGYSVLLSCVAREISLNGYITQLGIFHDNMFNELNLACDLMEPFRPFIDITVLNMSHEQFEHDEKVHLANFLNNKIIIDDREQYLLNGISIYTKSILDAIGEGNSEIVKFPKYELSIYESNSIL